MFRTSFEIDGAQVGGNAPVYVIAEAGANHNRDMGMAKKLIDLAADAGAPAVKFQTYSAETMYSKKTPLMSYLRDRVAPGTGIWDLIKKIELPREWQSELARYCKDRGITFLSTPFDLRAVDELAELNVAAFKIASFELVDPALIKHAAMVGVPMLLSTGMASLGDIEDALEAVESVGNDKVLLLHCAIGYPPPNNEINLRALQTLKTAFGVPVGFSDHTMTNTASFAAVALGAEMVEKHYTLDRSLPGPDHPFALVPEQLHELVQGVKEVSAALGTPRKWRTPNEEEMYRLARRSIVALEPIARGEIITADKLIVKRPGTGVQPKFWDVVVGRSARIDIQADDIITWDMV